jgi:hypothetical protein
MASVAACHRQAEADARAAGRVAIALEGFEDAVLGLVRYAGPAVDDPYLDPVGESARGYQDLPAGRAVLDGVLDDVGDGPFQQAPVDMDHGQRLGDVQFHALLGHPAERHGHDLVEVGLADDGGDRAGLQPGHVEQVADHVVEPVRALLDGLQQFCLVLCGPLDVVGAQ